MGSPSAARAVVALCTDMVETPELVEPWKALEAAGHHLTLVSDKDDSIDLFTHYDRTGSFRVDRRLKDARPSDYDALLLPGGVGNPDTLRMNPDAVAFVRHFFDAGKPVLAICHALWLLVEADVARGRTLTSWPSLRTDLANAGATWVDREVVVDGNLVTSRQPADIPAFNAAALELLTAPAPVGS